MQKAFDYGWVLFTASEEWEDITSQLDAPTSITLIRPDGGVGALQLSGARYKKGVLPKFDLDTLDSMLRELAGSFGFSRGLNHVRHANETMFVGETYLRDAELVRVWYVTNGKSVALVTYTCASLNCEPELEQCERIVQQIRLVD